jgi:hypothetical protein
LLTNHPLRSGPAFQSAPRSPDRSDITSAVKCFGKPSQVATYAFVNPVIALFLGRLLLGELLNAQILWATGIILAGVLITTLPKMRWER